MNKLIIALTFMLINFHCFASDTAKEKRWADQVVDSIIDGDAVWLNTTEKTKPAFLGILTEAAQDSEKAVIVMHGTGVHPDWQQIIQPLRVDLTENGWHSLSIQMPILANEAEYIDYAPLFEEVTPRINTAIKHLKTMGVKTIILIGHSMGSSMGAYHLSKSVNDISGFIGIGMGSVGNDNRMNQTHTLSKINIPVLDLYGEADLDSVLNTTKQRKDAAKKADNRHYTQVVTKGANHFYDDKDEALVNAVTKWLKQF